MNFLQLLGRRGTILTGVAFFLFVALPSALRLWTDAGLRPASRALMERATHIHWVQLYGTDIATSLAVQPIALAQLAVLSVTIVPIISIFLARSADLRGCGAGGSWRRLGAIWAERVARVATVLFLAHATVAALVAWKLGGAAWGFALHSLVGSVAVASLYSALGLAVAGWVRRPVWSVALCAVIVALLFVLRAAASARGPWLLVPAANDGFLIAGSGSELARALAILTAESCGLLLFAGWRAGRLRGRPPASLDEQDGLATQGKGAWV